MSFEIDPDLIEAKRLARSRGEVENCLELVRLRRAYQDALDELNEWRPRGWRHTIETALVVLAIVLSFILGALCR